MANAQLFVQAYNLVSGSGVDAREESSPCKILSRGRLEPLTGLTLRSVPQYGCNLSETTFCHRIFQLYVKGRVPRCKYIQQLAISETWVDRYDIVAQVLVIRRIHYGLP